MVELFRSVWLGCLGRYGWVVWVGMVELFGSVWLSCLGWYG
jgi:hypothetical protein